MRFGKLGQWGCGLGVGREDDVSFQRTCRNTEWDCRGGRPDEKREQRKHRGRQAGYTVEEQRGPGVRGKSHGLDFLPPWDGDWEEVSKGEGGLVKCFFRQLEREEMTGIEGQVWVVGD